jgi:hypothetical protein
VALSNDYWSYDGSATNTTSHQGSVSAFDDYAGSTATIANGSKACVSGTTLQKNGSDWGGGISVTLNETSPGTYGTVNVVRTGLGVGLTNLPASGGYTRINICVAPLDSNGNCPTGSSYCAELQSCSATISWSTFNQTCWQPTANGALPTTGGLPPPLSDIDVIVASQSTADTTYDFCLTQLTF